MSKRSRFISPLGSQCFNGLQSLFKSTENNFYTILKLIWDELGCKKLLLVRFDILALFLITMTNDDKISRRKRHIFTRQIQMHLSQQPKFLLYISLHFRNLHRIFIIYNKRESPSLTISEIIASEISGYYMSKRSRFRPPFGSQRVGGSKSLLKSAQHHFYTIFPLMWDKLSCKKLILVRFEILGLFLNTTTTDDKISRRNRDNLVQQIRMQLSQQQKSFSLFFFFFAFLKSTSNFLFFGEKKKSLIS